MQTKISRRRFLAGLGTTAVGATLVARTPRSTARAASPPAGPMRFGVTVYQPGPYEDLLAFWKDADRLGFDSAFLFDHLMPPARGDARAERCMEAWSLLSALAVATSRLRLGVLVTANTFRHPALVAKMAATVDQVSKGRLIIGLGAGWMPREHAAYGIPFYTPSERAKRLAEAVKVVKLLLTQEHSTFSGRYYTLKDAPCEPKGVQNPHPPMLVGGLGPKVVQPAAARHAQIWHFFKPGADVAEIRRLCEGFDAICRRVGRDPGTVEKATSVLVPKDDAGYKQLPQQIADLSAAGIRYVMFLPPPRNDRAALSRLAETVLPTSRAG